MTQNVFKYDSAGGAALGIIHFVGDLVAYVAEHLGKAEHTDAHGDSGYAAHDIDAAEGEALDAGNGVHADKADEHTEGGGEECLPAVLAGECGDDCHAAHCAEEHFRRAELERDLRKLRCKEAERGAAEQTAEHA